METMKLEQLIQATSGLSNRKETPVLVNGQPITEIRISIKDGAQCVNQRILTQNHMMCVVPLMKNIMNGSM